MLATSAFLIGLAFLQVLTAPAAIGQTTNKTGTRATDNVILRWKMASAYPGSLPLYGTLGKRLTEQLARASDGRIRLTFMEPGTSVRPEKCFEAVAEGKVEACWSSPRLWFGRERSLALFSGVPFGPSTREYTAWLYYGGGQALLDKIYAPYGLKSIICGVAAPEAGGWFRNEIKEVDDLKGVKMRINGFGARIVSRLGVQARAIPANKIVAMLKSGAIDAAEYANPSIDVALGFPSAVSNYYFPGWHQQTLLLELLVSQKAWDNLPDGTRTMITMACGDNIRVGVAQGEALQVAAIRALQAKGVSIREWPPEVLQALRSAWAAIVAEEIVADPNFKKVWQSLSAFRQQYTKWRKIGYID